MGSPRNIFLTGATGLIGGELVPRLAACKHAVSCLIRASDATRANGRLAARLARSNHQRLPPQVDAVCGDITRADFGLEAGVLDVVRKNCEVVIHAAADTSFRNDSACYPTNVNGVRRLLDFAASCRRLRRVFFVSSAAVCTAAPGGVVREESPFAGYANDYVRSKRHCEQLLLQSGLPVTILRPSVVLSRGIPDRAFARAILWILPLIREVGLLPLSGAERLDIIPVDFAVEAIVRLVEMESGIGCCHISAGTGFSQTCREISAHLKQVGWFRNGFHFSVRASGCFQGSSRLVSRINYYLPFMAADVIYENSRLREQLGSSMPACSRLTDYCLELLSLVTDPEAVAESRNA